MAVKQGARKAGEMAVVERGLGEAMEAVPVEGDAFGNLRGALGGSEEWREPHVAEWVCVCEGEGADLGGVPLTQI